MWLSAIPSGGSQPRNKNKNIALDLPRILGGEDLIEHLNLMGGCQYDSQGGSGFPYSEIIAYQQNMGFQFDPWETRTLFLMSREYARVLSTAHDPETRPPYDFETSEDRLKRIEAQIFG